MSARTLSVVVPLFDEEDNVQPLVEAVRAALDGAFDWELLLVDDGSRDRTLEGARAAALEERRVRVVALARNYGQATAMQAGFDHARGDVLVSMDGDLQNDPRDIPDLVSRLAEGYDLVAGYRVRRTDSLVLRRIPSWVANRLIRWTTGVRIRDNGCSLKAYDRRLQGRMRLYSDMHRFIPALAVATAGARIVEMPVRHHPRAHGVSKYGLTRTWKVLADLVTVRSVVALGARPLVHFGRAGAAAASVFALFASVIFFSPRGSAIGDALVLPAVAATWCALSVHLVFLGLLGEIVVHELRPRPGSPGRGRGVA